MTSEDENLTPKVAELRQRFEAQFSGNIRDGVYHENDLGRIRTEDGLLRCYLKHQKLSVEKAATMIDVSLKWRKELGVNDLQETSFPRELHELGAMYYHNHDKEGHTILYFQICKTKKDPERILLAKKFVAWWIEKRFLKSPEEPIVVIFDMTNAGISNMDMEQTKFIISCFTTYYPALLSYMLVYEMPWVLNALWKVIKTLLSQEQQRAVIFVKKHEIQQHIDKDQLWEHMGGTDTFQYQYLPSDDSGIDIPNGDISNITSLSDSTEPDTSPNTVRKRKVTFADKEQTLYTSFDAAEATEEEAAKPSGHNGRNVRYIRSGSKQMMVTADNKLVGHLATIRPAEFLKFEVVDATKETCDLLKITNTSRTHKIAYKVKTTSPDFYRVRPNTGIIKPEATVEISVFLQPDFDGTAQQRVTNDKFLIQFMEVDDSVTSYSQVGDKWKTVNKDSDSYMEHRMWCTLARPEEREVNWSLMESQLAQLVQDLKQGQMIDPEDKAELKKAVSGHMERKLKEIGGRQEQMEKRQTFIFRFILFQLFIMLFIAVALFVVAFMEYNGGSRADLRRCAGNLTGSCIFPFVG